MLAVIFEFEAAAGRRDDYLAFAAKLREELEGIDGFISIERFQSLTRSDRMLSLSFWRDEDAIENWRNLQCHREAQSAGRTGIFSDYRLRVAQVVRDYGLEERDQAPVDSKVAHDWRQ